MVSPAFTQVIKALPAFRRETICSSVAKAVAPCAGQQQVVPRAQPRSANRVPGSNSIQAAHGLTVAAPGKAATGTL